MKRFALLIMAALVVLATPTLAFDPEPGSRAYPVVGRDLVSGETISLEDYRGKWVLLEFWAYW